MKRNANTAPPAIQTTTTDGKTSNRRQHQEPRLLDNIWTSIVKRFRAQDAADRRHFLQTAQGIVVFQPTNIQKLIQVAMDEQVPSVRKWGLIRSTQEHILAQLSTLLGVTIVNEDVSSDAFARIWQLALHESHEVSGPAQRTLKSAIGYEIYKHPIYNERVTQGDSIDVSKNSIYLSAPIVRTANQSRGRVPRATSHPLHRSHPPPLRARGPVRNAPASPQNMQDVGKRHRGHGSSLPDRRTGYRMYRRCVRDALSWPRVSSSRLCRSARCPEGCEGH
jgi:hypothetical protein